MSKRPVDLLLNDIDLEIVWQVLHKDLPKLKRKLTQIMKNEGAG